MNKSLRTHSEKGIETTLQATGGLHSRFDEMINLLESFLNERMLAEMKTMRTDIQEMCISAKKLQAYSSIRAQFQHQGALSVSVRTAHAFAVWKSIASDSHHVGARNALENVDPEGNV